MKIKSLNIKNFKSIVDITINEPNPFTVFVGPNGSGKSNIFEALEFANLMTLENDLDEKLKFENKFDSFLPFLFSEDEIVNLSVGYEFNEEVLVFYWTKKTDFIVSVLNSAISDLERNKVVIEEALKSIGNEDMINLPFDFLLNRIRKQISAKYPSYDITIPIPKEKFEQLKSLKSVTNFLLDKEIINDFSNIIDGQNYDQFFLEFSRVFVSSKADNKDKYINHLNFNADNLEDILKKILSDKNKKEEFIDWLRLFVPEFDNLDLFQDKISGKDEMLVFEKFTDLGFTKSLISDGTYNIIALLTAVYQSEEPQFLCIEEPENGLHPFVIRKLVDFFRQACEDKGHYIWLNTHSQTLVECLNADEVIVVDKVEGETKITQLKGTNLHGLDMAEYWLSGATGGGTPW